MVFFCPIAHRIFNIFPNHRAFCSKLVTYTGPIRIFPSVIHPVVIAWYNRFKWPSLKQIRMIVYHIHDDTNTLRVKGLDHFLKFFNPQNRMTSITSVRSFGYIIILRVIPPIVFWTCLISMIYSQLIHCHEIKYRHQLNMCYTKLCQMINT
ncbi:hypothetical protein D3C76_1092910 [compost metagenome]